MRLVMLVGLPAVGKSFFRDRFVRTLYESIHEYIRDCDVDGIMNEHELYALNRAKNFRIVQASSDDILDMIALGQGSTYTAVFNKYKTEADLGFWHRLRLGVATRADLVIADRTFVSEKARKDVMQTVTQDVPGVPTVVVDFAAPEAEEWNRRLNARNGKHIPDEVMADMAKRRTFARDDAYKYDKVYEMTSPAAQEAIIKSLVASIMSDFQ